jgi:regulator of sirC expression with transglutaminase-like and TPR domain
VKAAFDAWYLRWQVRLLLVAGQKVMALDRLERYLDGQPDDAYALASSAHLRAGQGDKAGAIISLERLVRVQPQQASAWFNL